MQITLRHVRPVSVAFVRAFGPYDVSAPAAWAQLDDWVQSCNLRDKLNEGFGVMRDDPRHVGPYLRRYDACVPVLPGMPIARHVEIGRQFLPGGVYAVYRHAGAEGEIAQLLSEMHRRLVPRKGYSVDYGRPFVEAYRIGGDMPAKRTVELCVPVKAVLSFGGFEARGADIDLAA